MAGETRNGSCFRDRWRDLLASADGPPSATTRHVLLTLSLNMDRDGGHCFPSTRLLAERAGLSQRFVCIHLALAVDGGWLSKERRQGDLGQGWRRNEYQAMLPKALTQGKHVARKGTYPRSARSSEGEYPHDKKVSTQGQSNQSKNQGGVQTEANGSALKALEEVCVAMGAEWDRSGLTPEQWVSQKAGDPRFAVLDFATVFSDAADYLSSAKCRKKKYTSPSLFLLRQLKMATERAKTQAPAAEYSRL